MTEKFSAQRKMKSESQSRIVEALMSRPMSFTELMKSTGLSKPVLAQRLTEMKREKQVEKIYIKAQDKICYTLTVESLRDSEIAGTAFSWLSRSLFKDFEEESVEEFLGEFSRRAGVLITFILFEGLKARGEPAGMRGLEPARAAERWVEKAVDMYFLLGIFANELSKRISNEDLQTQINIKWLRVESEDVFKMLMDAFKGLYPKEANFLDHIVARLPKEIEEIKKVRP